jgi:hypothetical protein
MLILVSLMVHRLHVQGHGEGGWNSPNATVSVYVTDDNRTNLAIHLDGDMCDDETVRLCTINVSNYIAGDDGAPACPLYNLSVVEADVTHHCRHHGDEMWLLFVNKYGCEENPFVQEQEGGEEDMNSTDGSSLVRETSDDVGHNATNPIVNETNVMNTFATAVSISGHACVIHKIENVRVNGAEVAYSWEEDASTGMSGKQKLSLLWLGLCASAVHATLSLM